MPFTPNTASSKTLPYYGPQSLHLLVLKAGLRGGDHDGCAFLAPSLLPSPLPWVDSLHHFLNSPSEKPAQELVSLLSKYHVQLFNHYYLCKPLVREINDYLSIADGEIFIREQLHLLRHEYKELIDFTHSHFNFSKALQDVLINWVCATSPIMMIMGYPDAIPHAGQVARLCLVKSAESSQHPIEQLQAAMVGWLHDPKFIPLFSLDNLSTHPIVAATMADDILQNHAPIHDLIHRAFKSVSSSSMPSPWPLTLHNFSKGITQALSINNDSRYVMEKFIQQKLDIQIQKQAFLHQHAPEATEKTLNTLNRIIADRLSGPSQGKPIPTLPESLLKTLSQTSFDSGLIGLHADSWEKLCQTLYPDILPAHLYQTIINGELNNLDIVIDIYNQLTQQARHHDNAFLYWPIDSQILFSHHEEVCPSGQIAALSLACSDPLMLSPHKIIATRPEKEPLQTRIQSYLTSLRDNINDLPASHQASGKSWQRAILFWLLKSAEELTHANLVKPFIQSHLETSLDEDIADLERFIDQPTTWGILTDINAHHSNQQHLIQHVIDVIQTHYVKLCKTYRHAVLNPNIDETKLTE